MNPRIRELAEQAALYAVSDNSSMLFDVWKKRYTEKFAELIVRECIDIISPYAVRMENFDGGHPITDLKKHFGVEP